MTWAAGVILISKKTKRLALALRSRFVSNPYTYSAIGGFVDKGESPKEAVIREVKEEFGLNIDENNLLPLDKIERIGLDYWLFGYFIDDEIKLKPQDNENIRFEWRYFDQWNNLHPKLKQSMNQKHMKNLFSNYSKPNHPIVKGAEDDKEVRGQIRSDKALREQIEESDAYCPLCKATTTLIPAGKSESWVGHNPSVTTCDSLECGWYLVGEAEESDIMNIECSKCGQINTWYHSYACGGLCLNKECRNHIKNPKHQPYEIDNYCYYESTCDMCEEENPVASVVWDYGESVAPAGYCLDCLEANPPQEYGDKYKMLPWAKAKEPKYVKEEQEEDSDWDSGLDDRESIYDILQTFAVVENVESGMTQQQWIGILDEFEQLMPIPKLEMKEENIYDILKTFAIVKNVESGMTQKQWMEMLDEMKESFDFQTKYQAEEHEEYTCEACWANWQEGGLCPMCIKDGIFVCWVCCSIRGGHPEFACSVCGGVGSRVSELPPNEGALGADCISCDGTGIDEQAWNDALEKNAESFAADNNDKEILEGFIGRPVAWKEDYGDGQPDETFVGATVEWGGPDEYDEWLIVNKDRDRWMNLDSIQNAHLLGWGNSSDDPQLQDKFREYEDWMREQGIIYDAEEKTIKVGLVKGRHELPVDNYVFDEIVHSNGFAELILNKLVKDAKQWISRNSYVGPGTVELYITGFTPALTAFIIAWNYMDVDFELIFKHYDNETGDYVSQTYEAEDWATNH